MHRQKPNAGNTSSQSWPVSYKWLAAGTLAIYTAIGCSRLSGQQVPVLAKPSLSKSTVVAALPVRHFDIPPGIVRDAIQNLSKASGIEITVGNDGIAQLATPGVSGLMTPEQALDQLLRSSGVRWRFTGPAAVIIELNPVVATVEVSTSATALATSIPKFTEPLRDTPQTVNVVSQQTMQDQNVTTLRDALRNVAGISMAAGEGGAQGDNLTIRGFSARNDLFIDGMRDFGSYYRDPFNIEELDVIQGPSAATFGRGSTGGVVNQATKMPSTLRNLSGTFDGGTDATRRATLDFNQPFKALDRTAAFRFNVMGTEGDVAGRDVAHNRRYGIAPSLAWGLGSPTRVTLSFLNQQADDTPDYGIPWLFNQPAPVDRHNYYGFADGSNYLRTRDNIATVRVEHDWNGHISIRNQSRYARYARDAQITEGLLLATTPPADTSTPLASIPINRNELNANSVEAFLANQTDVTMNFQTGSVRQNAVAGAELAREDSDPNRLRFTGVPTTSLLSPDATQAFAGTGSYSSIARARSSSAAAYIIDTAKLGSHWELNGSFRFDRFNSHFTQAVAPAAAFNRLDHLPSWRGGVVYKPVVPLSIYVSAGNSFNPSAESLSLSSATTSLPPEENRSYEAGVKWDLPHPGLSLRAAAFRTDKLNAREPDPTNSLLNVLAGRQKVQGVQAEVSGHVNSHWDMQTSYAYLNAKLVASNAYPSAIGARLANVPAHTFAFWNTYRLPWRVRLGAGGSFVGTRTASSTVPLDPTTQLVKAAPGYWVFNALVEKAIHDHVTVHANVYNLGDRYYYDQLHPGHIVLGPARHALMGIRFTF